MFQDLYLKGNLNKIIHVFKLMILIQLVVEF